MVAGVLTAPAASGAVSNAPDKAAHDPGSIGVQLLDASAARRNDPRAHIYIDDHLKPGTTITRHIRVTNTSAGALHLRFYADSASVSDGSFIVTPGHGTNELTQWTTVAPAAGTVPAHSAITLTVTVAVPPHAEPGERYAVVLADLPPKQGRAGAVAVGSRVGIRMYLSVGNGAEPASNFAIDSMTGRRTSSGQPEVDAAVHNTGGRAVDLSGTLTLDHGPGGLQAGPFPVELGTTLGIGQTAPVKVLLDPRLPDGPWRARLTLTSGPLTRAAEAPVTFPTAAGTSGPTVPAKAIPLTERKSVMGPIAGGILGLVALLFFLYFLWRRRRVKGSDDDSKHERAPELVRSP